jgi:hypothetical protein
MSRSARVEPTTPDYALSNTGCFLANIRCWTEESRPDGSRTGSVLFSYAAAIDATL